MLIRKNSNITKWSPAKYCGMEAGTCYIAAEIDSALVDNGNYICTVGDGKTYGGYVNHQLQSQFSYSVQIAINVYLPQVNSLRASQSTKRSQLNVMQATNHFILITQT